MQTLQLIEILKRHIIDEMRFVKIIFMHVKF
jgi:hypothetical protein